MWQFYHLGDYIWRLKFGVRYWWLCTGHQLNDLGSFSVTATETSLVNRQTATYTVSATAHSDTDFVAGDMIYMTFHQK